MHLNENRQCFYSRWCIVVLVRGDLEFGLLSGIEKQARNFGGLFGEMLEARPQTRGVYLFLPSTGLAAYVGWRWENESTSEPPSGRR
jgi:hypothetical protein